MSESTSDRSVMPRLASASMTAGWERSITSHSCHSSTVMLGCCPGKCSQALTSSAVSDTVARYAWPSARFQQTTMACRAASSPDASAARSALAGSFSSTEANRQSAPTPRSRRTIADTRRISSADKGSSGWVTVVPPFTGIRSCRLSPRSSLPNFRLLGPVELVLRDPVRAAVCLGLGPSRAVAARVAEDPAGVDDERLFCSVQIRVPPEPLVKRVREGTGEALHVAVLRLELDERPQFWLPGGRVARGRAGALSSNEANPAEFRSSAHALRDQRALDHECPPSGTS